MLLLVVVMMMMVVVAAATTLMMVVVMMILLLIMMVVVMMIKKTQACTLGADIKVTLRINIGKSWQHSIETTDLQLDTVTYERGSLNKQMSQVVPRKHQYVFNNCLKKT